MNKIMTRLTSFICVLVMTVGMAPVSLAQDLAATDPSGYEAVDTVNDGETLNQEDKEDIADDEDKDGDVDEKKDVDNGPSVTADEADDADDADVVEADAQEEEEAVADSADETEVDDLDVNADEESPLTITLDKTSYEYNGSVIKPYIDRVQDPATSAILLKEQYEAQYVPSVVPGTYKVTVVGKEEYKNYQGEAQYTITPANVAACTINPIAAVTYTGAAQAPAVTVIFNGTTLVNGTDYTVGYSNNINAGTATATITGKGNFTGTKSANFVINKANQSISISPNPVSVNYKKTKTLKVSGAKGAVSYKSNKPSIASVTSKGKITGKKCGSTSIVVSAAGNANYNAASKTVSVKVKGKELKASTTKIKLSKTKYTYDGKAKTPTPTVKYKGKKLKKNRDYTVKYQNNKNAGKATIIITGKGAYEGTRKVKYTIQKANNTLKATIDDNTILPNEKANIKVKKSVGEVTFESSDTSVATVNHSGVVTGKATGKVTIKVTAEGDVNHKKGVVKIKVEVGYHNITDKACTVKLSNTNYTYNGDPKAPTVTVKYDGVTLKKNRDYTVSYDDNVNAGTGRVILKGKGKYRGTRIVNFKINKAEQSNFKASIKNNTIPLGGTAVVFVSGARGKVTFGSLSPSYAQYIGNATYRGLKATKEGITVTVKAAGDDNYKSKTIELWVSVK
jgi:hypothetical protein